MLEAVIGVGGKAQVMFLPAVGINASFMTRQEQNIKRLMLDDHYPDTAPILWRKQFRGAVPQQPICDHQSGFIRAIKCDFGRLPVKHFYNPSCVAEKMRYVLFKSTINNLFQLLRMCVCVLYASYSYRYNACI